MSALPLKGLIVLEFSQYLSGPSAGLRLADLGARVIKIERPGTGEAGRKLSIKNLWAADGSSLLFHTINRNKESFAADLKNADDLEKVKQLIAQADVITHNFRPGVMEKAGLSFAEVQAINPRVIYAEISGYGKRGPWKNRPGQDLLLQSMSGLTYTTGDAVNGPVPFGLSIGDTLCGAQLVQGILAALIRRSKTGQGAFVEISLLESLLDFQFELLTTYYASGKQPQRSNINNGHPLLSAPYGIYATDAGYIAIAMNDLQQVAKAVQCNDLLQYGPQDAFSKRDEIKECIAKHLLTNTASYWQQQLHAAGLWAMEVLNWQQLSQQDGYRRLQMEQALRMKDGTQVITTRCPIRINGQKLYSTTPGPVVGEHNKQITREFLTTTTA
ncbi:Crotonobetainyl-CoA:carnitine CoA-transferase CaiB [Filimonas lacunae]|uniref:Crotonobetainyl-CoA:carnitine CoA-transferase CaiB n=1 Tax=Filimonas lacunae TaxID=477680 RepID=A0A173MCG6_9BACT|nr:CaiB/BaiF CoA-transferase family protein [Filimonas lacunae]BAV05151.1 racemase [Filimonas lacunae]SIT34148.1 Crotonobetainyl-CoA:carnitine CoA-transferase CaiB [Filimonas lacunae]